MKTRSRTIFSLISVFFCLVSLHLQPTAQEPQEESAWEALTRSDPGVVDAPELSWLDRLALAALRPEQARFYLAGASPQELTLEDGTTLAEHLRRRLSDDSGGVFVPLPVSCPLFSLNTPESGDAIALALRGDDLSEQGGSPLGCRIPDQATALVIRLEARTEAGLRPAIKVWSEGTPQPIERVMEGGETQLLTEGATALVALCRNCSSLPLRLLASESVHVTGRILGFYKPADSGSGGLAPVLLVEAADLTAVGSGALANNAPSGDGNTAVGVDALNANTIGDLNTAVGEGALRLNFVASDNTAVGAFALTSSFNGRFNTAVGANAMRNSTSGSSNSAFGSDALFSNTTGQNNTGLGMDALRSNTSGVGNTAVGTRALIFNEIGESNTAVGGSALQFNRSSGNSAVGSFALTSNTTGIANTAVGKSALFLNTTASRNTAVGADAMSFNRTGASNAAVGKSSLQSNTSGSFNTAMGDGALGNNTTGDRNTALGENALRSNSTGSLNTAVGDIAGNGPVSGDSNSYFGFNSSSADALTNATAIGAQSFVSQDNSLVLGSIAGVNRAASDVDVGIGTSAPAAPLHVSRSKDSSTRVLIDNTNAAAQEVGLRLSNASQDWDLRNDSSGSFAIAVAGSAVAQLSLSATGDLVVSGNLTTGGSGACNPGPCDGTFKDYELESIEEHAAYMWKNAHLWGVGPTPEGEPFNLTRKTAGILHELEKAHIYIEQLNTRIKKQQAQIETLQEQIQRILAGLATLDSGASSEGSNLRQ